MSEDIYHSFANKYPEMHKKYEDLTCLGVIENHNMHDIIPCPIVLILNAEKPEFIEQMLDKPPFSIYLKELFWSKEDSQFSLRVTLSDKDRHELPTIKLGTCDEQYVKSRIQQFEENKPTGPLLVKYVKLKDIETLGWKPDFVKFIRTRAVIDWAYCDVKH
nr:hypothetical protein [Abalone asfa-like virus]